MTKQLTITDSLKQNTNLSNDHLYSIVKKIESIKSYKEKNNTLLVKIGEIQSLFNERSALVTPSLLELKKEVIKKYIFRLSQKSFSNTQRGIINDLIELELSNLRSMNLMDAELEQISNDLAKQQSAKLNAEEIDFLNELVSEKLSESGFEVPKDFSYEDLLNNPNAFFEEFARQQAYEQEKINEIQKKEIVSKTDLDFQKMYKFLAKKLHPDKKPNDGDAEKNEEAMKELTTAWNERNYYKILLLWLELDPDNSLQIDFSPKNYKNIIKSLNDEINELKYQDYLIKNEMEGSAFIYQNFFSKSEKIIKKKIKEYTDYIEELKSKALVDLERANKTKEFKEFLTENLNAMNYHSMFSSLFSDSIFDSYDD